MKKWGRQKTTDAQTQHLLLKHRSIEQTQGYRGREKGEEREGRSVEKERDEKQKRANRPSSEQYSQSLAVSGSSLITPGFSPSLTEINYTTLRAE